MFAFHESINKKSPSQQVDYLEFASVVFFQASTLTD
jgi:hypothetical protein